MEKKDPYAALRYPEFRQFLFMRFALVFAWSMQFVVIEWQVYSLTKDPLSLGIIGLMEVIPAVGLALIAGHIADQREKRKLLLQCIIGFLAISFGLFSLTWPAFTSGIGAKQIAWGIYALVFVGGAVRAFIGPSVFSLFALVIPRSVYPNAAGWSSSVWQIGAVLGPAVGGLSILWVGVHWSMLIIVGFAAMSFLTLLRIGPKPIMNTKANEGMRESLKEGIRFVTRTKEIFGALTLDMVAVLFGGAVALLPIYAQDILRVGPTGFGILRAAPAVGSFVIMLGVAYFPLHRNAGIKLLASIFAFGLCIIVFGLSSIFWVSVLALFLSGIFDGISMVVRQTILQLRTPDEMRGRVAAVSSMFVGSSNELGAFESGVTAKWMGTVSAVVFGGCMTLATVVGAGVIFPSLRKLDLEEDIAKAKASETVS
jgi:MFS family permease